MASLRKGIAIRKLERPYTRKSKYKNKSYIKAIPNHKINKFEMGDKAKIYKYKVKLVSIDTLQIRHNALESARMIVNRQLQQHLPGNYFFRVCVYPHHIIRENRMLGGSHADRVQSGMGHPFGKPTGVAAQIKKGKEIFAAWVNEQGLERARIALRTANPKLPGRCSIVVEESNKSLN